MASIYQCQTDQDFDTFITMEFEAAQENNMVDTSKSYREQLQVHREELTQFINGKQKTGIFFAQGGDHNPQGYIWISERGYREAWDFQSDPAWIYDVRVLPEHRGKGLGQVLMHTAEGWAKQNQFSRIGLHVFGANQPAINLYLKLGFATLNCNVQKDIRDQKTVSKPNANPYTIRPFDPERDKARLFDAWWESFNALAQSQNQNQPDLIRIGFDNFIKDVRFDNPDIETFVFAGTDDELQGFFRLATLKQGDKQVAWIGSAGVLPVNDQELLARLSIKYAEHWAHQKGLNPVMAGVVAFDNRFSHFTSAGYQQTSLYMFKSLS